MCVYVCVCLFTSSRGQLYYSRQENIFKFYINNNNNSNNNLTTWSQRLSLFNAGNYLLKSLPGVSIGFCACVFNPKEYLGV